MQPDDQSTDSQLLKTMQPAPPSDVVHSIELRNRILLDLGSQNLISLILYPVLWLYLMLHAGLAAVGALFFWSNLFVLLVSTSLRYYAYVRIQKYTLALSQGVERILIGAILLNAAQWSFMTLWAIMDPDLLPIKVAMIIVATGMIGSGTFALAIHTVLRIMFPIILALPTGIALLFSVRSDERVWGGLCVVLLGYVLVAARKRQQDYFKAINTAILLEQRTKELEQISFNDPVTGLKNRSYFDAHFDLEWKRAHRQHYPLSLLVIDLDHFKSINDRFGHPVGDRCLAELGACLGSAKRRPGDVLARFGGDEFILLLVNAEEAAVATIAATLISQVSALLITERTERISLTVSIGVATVVPAGQELAEAMDFLALADTALYAAKQGGRNQWKRATDVSLV